MSAWIRVGDTLINLARVSTVQLFPDGSALLRVEEGPTWHAFSLAPATTTELLRAIRTSPRASRLPKARDAKP